MMLSIPRSTINVASGHSVQRTSHTGSHRLGRTVARANKTPTTASTTLTASATTNHVGAVSDRTLSIISCESGAMDHRASPPDTQYALSTPYAAVIAAAQYAGQVLVPNHAPIAATVPVLA
jgi:hypothetical protein